MGYRIVEKYVEHDGSQIETDRGVYESAYDAVDEFRHALRAGDPRVWSWRLVDDVGTVLFGPGDLAAIDRSA